MGGTGHYRAAEYRAGLQYIPLVLGICSSTTAEISHRLAVSVTMPPATRHRHDRGRVAELHAKPLQEHEHYIPSCTW